MARPKRKPGDRDRTQLWYELVMESMIAAGVISKETGGRKLGEELENKAEKLGLPWQGCREHMGSPEAWRWYQTGARTPSRKTRAAVDILLSKLGQQTIGWLLLGSEEVELVPVWAWPISQTELNEPDGNLCAEFEKKFWQRLRDYSGESIPRLCHEYGIVKGYPDLGEHQTNWPPRILMPSDVAHTLSIEAGSPFPHLFSQRPEFSEAESELLSRFRSWSHSSSGKYADGEEWYHRLRTLPGSPFYSGGMIACIGVQALEDLAEKKLEEDIRHHFASQKGHISGDGK